ncbi:isoleucine--tRNA ligase, cytoplasmic-like [Eupeodes corollae]|uniref:isoleucine--tRNA ligase, cytoplasmic-like n=1 Tax=Eupeodes corollae TaxID=290404 RepID=UPI00249387DC|nr:isoleucine--tRNA ligase, cytoplasmic-like [Eupeodes corollae]
MTRFHHNITIPEVYNPLIEEPKIIKFWHKKKTFHKIKTNRREKNDGKFCFHSAPVSCNGHPHSGQILNSLIKDVLKRYGYQKNCRVDSIFRWDGHNLPIQHEVDRELGITHEENLKRSDAKLYNEYCRTVGQEHTAEWMSVFQRLGHCVDWNKDYSTSDNRYMQGVWKVFKQLYDQGLVYRDTKPLFYSTVCSSHFTKFQAEENLKEVSEIGSTIALRIVDSSEKLLIWTTNPWMLAFNSRLYVNPKATYVRVKVEEQTFILAENSLEFVFKNPSEYSVIEKVLGESLAKIKCESLFENVPPSSGFRINTDPIKSDDEEPSTGITGSANLSSELLKNGTILNTKEVKYKRPHCPKSGTPLERRNIQSWFIRVEEIVEDFLRHIMSFINWVPEQQVSEKDLVKWIENHFAQWPISRRGQWGTPVPIWSSPSGDEVVCVESLEELKKLSGKKNIPDLHRENVDFIRIPSRTPGNPPLRRVSDVFDGWFESGALPFIWERYDQADFAAEGNDQTREWFYTTVILATALARPSPYRNVITHGLTLEANETKVLKRKHNRNDPMRLCEKYGADAFRLYMLNCSQSNFTVKEEGVARMAETVIQPLYRIFHKCTSQMGSPSWVNYGYISEWTYHQSQDLLDQWILSRTESLLKFYIDEMNAFRVNSFLPKLIELLGQIEAWYIPLRCPEPNPKDKETSINSTSIHLSTSMLFNVIYRLCLILAPVAPFLTEFIYQIHKKWMVFYVREESMHEARLFPPCVSVIKPDLELNIQRMQSIMETLGSLRGKHMIPMQYQIQEVVVIHHNEKLRDGIDSVKKSFLKMMNVVDMRVSEDHREFGISRNVKVKEDSNSNKKQLILENLTEEELNFLIKEEDLEEEKDITLEDLVISYEVPKDTDLNIAIAPSEELIVVMKMNKSLSFYEEGTVKELIHQICSLKRRRNYYRKDSVVIMYTTEDECLKNVIAKYGKT